MGFISGRRACRYVFGSMLFLAAANLSQADDGFAALVPDGTGVYWELRLDPDLGVSLSVAGPDRDDAAMFGAGEQPHYPADGLELAPGFYKYEMVVVPGSTGFTKRDSSTGPGSTGARSRTKTDSRLGAVQTGHFRVDDAGYVMDFSGVSEN